MDPTETERLIISIVIIGLLAAALIFATTPSKRWVPTVEPSGGYGLERTL